MPLPDSVCFFFLVLPQGYVDNLVEYIRQLSSSWVGHAEYDTTCGARLGVEVITTFWGDRCPSYVGPNSKDGDDPTWLKLKWGVAIASRSLDAWTAAKNNFSVDAVSHYPREYYTHTSGEALYRCMPTRPPS